MEVTAEKVICKLCASQNVVRYGTIGTIQRWRCKDCKRSYLGNDNLPQLKTATRQIIDALYLYCEGVPLSSIRRYMIVMYNNYPSISTIHHWLIRFARLTIQNARAHKPNVGGAWIADNRKLWFGNNYAWAWDLIDVKSHFLLASNLSFTRTINDALTLTRLAQEWAGKAPELVFTNNLSVYSESIESTWGSETKHIPSSKFTALNNHSIMDILYELRKGRARILRGIKKIETAKLIMDGWMVHYNFFRPQEMLGDRTPADIAGIKFPIIQLQKALLIEPIKATDIA